MTQSNSSQSEVLITDPVTLSPAAKRAVNWPHVGAFLGVSFGLTWLIDLVLYLNGGLTHPATSLILQTQMLMPAFAALLLGVFFFKESPVYHKTNHTASRWFIYFYLLMTVVYLAATVVGFILPSLAATLSASLLLLSVVGLILLAVLRWRGGPQSFAGAGMAFGKIRLWLLYGLLMVLFYGMQTLLNYVFKLGTPVDITNLYPPEAAAAAAAVPPLVLLASAFFNAVIIGPFLGLIITFGEEYGWRGYLTGRVDPPGPHPRRCYCWASSGASGTGRSSGWATTTPASRCSARC